MQPNHTIKKRIAWILFGILAIGTGIFFANNKNPSFIADNLNMWGLYRSSGTLLVDTNQANQDLALQKFRVILPKSKVSPAYSVAFNRVLNEVFIIDNTYKNEMAPLVMQTIESFGEQNSQDADIFGGKILSLNETQKKRLAILTGYISNLTVVNSTISDNQTKILTAEFILASKNLMTTWISYGSLVDKFSSRDVNAQTVNEAKTIKPAYDSAVASFTDVSQKLSAYFNQTIVNDLKAAEAASSTTIKR